MSETPEIGSNFYQRVYHWTRQIPPGKVTTYGAIAALCGNPMAPRAVGYALRALPPDTDVPWHRVINKAGKISPRGLDPGHSILLQRCRLEQEGIVFDASDSVDWGAYGWFGPSTPGL